MEWRYGTNYIQHGGSVTLADTRRDTPSGIVLHRNSVHEIWHRDHPHMSCVSDIAAMVEWYADRSNPYYSRLFPYHWVVTQDGSVYQLNDPMTVTPHTRGKNRKAVGVALGIDGRRVRPSGPMLRSLNKLLVHLHSIWPAATFEPHDQVGKKCPGQLVDTHAIWQKALNEGDNHGDER